jgi:hypothetical protein
VKTNWIFMPGVASLSSTDLETFVQLIDDRTRPEVSIDSLAQFFKPLLYLRHEPLISCQWLGLGGIECDFQV